MVLVVVGAGVCITRPVDGVSPSGRAGGAADNESVRAPWCCPFPARLDPRPFATFGLLRVDVVIVVGQQTNLGPIRPKLEVCVRIWVAALSSKHLREAYF